MKNVLEYTEQELKELNKEQLEILLHEAEQGESLYNTQQMVAKLSINSLYGALANKYFPLFNQEIARAITGNGRYFILSLGNLINKRLSEKLQRDHEFLIGGDTDSTYFSLLEFVKQKFPDYLNPEKLQEITDWVDQFTNENIQPIIQECIDTFAKDLNAFDKSVIGADREIIASHAIFLAKKKYAARVIDSEGVRYNPFKIKAVGLEIVKSSTPDFIKKKLKDEALSILFDGTLQDAQQWLEKSKEEFVNQPLDKISKASGVTRIDYTIGGTETIPINSRASIIYNNYIKEHRLEDSFDLITAEDNMRMVYLRTPNPFGSDIVAFKDTKFIEQFREYVDFDTNFEKYFLSPFELMTNALGYNLNQFTEELDEW